MKMISHTEDLRELDAADPLAAFRRRFEIPDGIIYLDGNSLGALPASAARRARRTVETEWGKSLISSWNEHGWIDLPSRTGARIASLIGAEPHETIVADSVSINLFKVVSAALDARPGRTVVVTDPEIFPTDLYMLEGLVASRGNRCKIRYCEAGRLYEAIGPDVAAVCFSHVDYRTARIEDMRQVNQVAHDAGALTIWDLSHSLGAIEINLKRDGTDFAVGCGYKYLNGGPGAPAMLYAAERHLESVRQPLTGWMGHATPFEFSGRYLPAAGIRKFLTGTPPILSLSVLDESVQIMTEAPMHELREKSKRLTSLLIALVEERCHSFGFKLMSPREEDHRGSHVLFDHAQGYSIIQALKHRGVIGDFRSPDGVRMGVAPLYNSYQDIGNAVEHLVQVMTEGEYDRDEFKVRASVT